MPSLFDLTGKIAVVTGGNGGIGLGLAIGLGQAGATVAILGRNAQKNEAAQKAVEATGAKSMIVPLDVLKRDHLKDTLDQVKAELGPIDILVNNAGIALASGGVLKEEPENWDMVLETNLNSVYLLSKYAAQQMIDEGKGGKIINLASMYAFFGASAAPSYAASKGGIVQLTKSTAMELAKHNIQVNAIAPGWITTDMTSPVKDSKMGDQILGRTPAGRWGEPEDLAGTVIFLASKASDFVTGITIPVDGGYSVA